MFSRLYFVVKWSKMELEASRDDSSYSAGTRFMVSPFRVLS